MSMAWMRIKKVSLAVAVTLLTLLGLELYLRVFPKREEQVNNPYKYTKKIGKPAFQQPFYSMQELYPLQFDNSHYYEKSKGRISYDFNQVGARWLKAEPQKISRLNVFVLGDSFTLGFGLRYEDSYVYKLQDRLGKRGLSVGFWNFSMPAADAIKCLSIYRACSDRIQHEMILYGLDLNDLIEFPTSYVITPKNSGGSLSLRNHSKLFDFLLTQKNRYIDKRERLRELTSPAVFQKSFFRKNMEAIEEIARQAKQNRKEFRIVVLPVLVDLKKDSFRPVYNTIMDAFNKRGIKYYDLTKELAGFSDSDLWILPFDQHPNEKANAIFAEQLLPLFIKDSVL